MRILVVHGWLTGNLGDVMQTRVLLEGLRELRLDRLDLAGHPAVPAAACSCVLGLVDRFLPEEPSCGGPAWARRGRFRGIAFALRKRERRRLFLDYDAVVSAPGPFLTDYDRRAQAAFADLAAARALGIPFVFSSHSIGPLGERDLARLSAAELIVAREEVTHAYLRGAGIESQLAADYSSLYPHPSGGDGTEGFRSAFGPDYRLVILRHNNLDLNRLERRGSGLWLGERAIVADGPGTLVLGTSDPSRDADRLSALGKRLGMPFVPCGTPEELLALIRGAGSLVSDRYHPCLCSAAAGKATVILENQEPHKMKGLQLLLSRYGLNEVRRSASAGLESVRQVLLKCAASSRARAL